MGERFAIYDVSYINSLSYYIYIYIYIDTTHENKVYKQVGSSDFPQWLNSRQSNLCMSVVSLPRADPLDQPLRHKQLLVF